jgi:membrane protease YdiL (CAAX protease family)
MRAVLTRRHILETRFAFTDFVRVFALSIVLYVGFIGLFLFSPHLSEWLAALHPTFAFLVQYLVQFLILFFPLWLFVLAKHRATFADFGFKRIKLSKLALSAISGYLFYIIFSITVVSILTLTQVYIPGYDAQDPYLPLFGTDLLGFTTAGFFLILIGPFLEETLFRGFIYPVFNKTWPTWMASLLSAILFALVHFQFQNILPLIFLGLILNFVYHRTGSIWAPIALHMLNNIIAFSLELTFHFHPGLLDELETLSAFLHDGLML